MPNCNNDHIGQRALADMRSPYMGYAGGLYPNESNTMPAAHEAAGVALADTIEPLNAGGHHSPTGKVVIAGLGFSTSRLIWQQVMTQIDVDSSISPMVQAINLCVPGQDATDIADADSSYWKVHVPNLLATAGVTAVQVQVAWFMSGRQPPQDPSFPNHALGLRDLLIQCVKNARAFFPNLKQVYLSNPIYHGYWDGDSTQMEPYCFEQGFSFKWLIEEQLNGNPELNYDPALGTVNAAWMAWSSNVWCDGVWPTADGLDLMCSEVKDQGQHTNPAGSSKIAKFVLRRLKGLPTCAPWLLASGAAACATPAEVELRWAGVAGASGQPRVSLTHTPVLGTAATLSLRLFNAAPDATAWVMLGQQLQPNDGLPFGAGKLYVDWMTPNGPLIWQATTAADGTLSLPLSDVPSDPDYCGSTWYAQVAVVDPTAPQGWAISEAMVLTVGA